MPLSAMDSNKDNTSTTWQNDWTASFWSALGQVPAVALIAVFHLMIGIPFGVSYFPIGWRSDTEATIADDTTHTSAPDDAVNGPFPLAGKEALGIRMFLYSTIIAQLVFTWKSHFHSPIGLQMVENVPFYHELAAICIQHCGYGQAALTNLFFLFGLSSVMVGLVFYLLGTYKLGRIVYFFPTHVLVGCIGGIGFYLCKTGLEVTTDAAFSMENIVEDWNLLRVTFFFEGLLRLLERVTLDANGKPRYSLLSSIYFCMISPLFYLGLLIFQFPLQNARDEGYFFPTIATATLNTTSTSEGSGSHDSFWQIIMEDKGMFDLWRILDVRVISLSAITEALPTIVALTLFSLIHVPINVPSLGISTKQDAEMDNELVAHGYSNFIAGICGCGLQNYLAYTQSVVYDRSGGKGKRSGVAVALVTALLFVIGPAALVPYIPRCMAGALLLHVGLDLFFEGVYDSIGQFDKLEYAGIWLIIAVMALYGMEAAMVAGIISAVSTYAMQSITYLNPLRGSMSAETLRSSHRSRNHRATAVIDDPVNGRSRIVVVQLQGHLFFGNLAQLNSGIDNVLITKSVPEIIDGAKDREILHRRRVVILDFSLVVGIDSSAAQGLIKLQKNLMKRHKANVVISVAGSDDGFPCEFDLTNELTFLPHHHQRHSRHENERTQGSTTKLEAISEATHLLYSSTMSMSDTEIEQEHQELLDFSGSFVVESLDLALIFAENVLIAWEDPSLLDGFDPRETVMKRFKSLLKEPRHQHSSLITEAMLNPSRPSSLLLGQDEEIEIAFQCLMNTAVDRNAQEDIRLLLSHFQRETYAEGDFVWKQNDTSDSTKILVIGTLKALLENESGTSEVVFSGNIIGELGLIQGIPRFSSVQCVSQEGAVLYSLSRNVYEEMIQSAPQVARHIDLMCITSLANRIQHVSNRIFETRCLPI